VPDKGHVMLLAQPKVGNPSFELPGDFKDRFECVLYWHRHRMAFLLEPLQLSILILVGYFPKSMPFPAAIPVSKSSKVDAAKTPPSQFQDSRSKPNPTSSSQSLNSVSPTSLRKQILRIQQVTRFADRAHTPPCVHQMSSISWSPAAPWP
jgi:hypothetical protein